MDAFRARFARSLAIPAAKKRAMDRCGNPVHELCVALRLFAQFSLAASHSFDDNQPSPYEGIEDALRSSWPGGGGKTGDARSGTPSSDTSRERRSTKRAGRSHFHSFSTAVERAGFGPLRP